MPLVLLTATADPCGAAPKNKEFAPAAAGKKEERAKSPKEETEEILNALMPFAKQMLEKHGEFFPFGGAMLIDGKITMVGMYDGDERPPSQKVIDGLLEGFRAEAKRGRYKAIGIAFDIRTVPPGSTKKTDAVAVRLDHVSGYSVQVAFPYRITEKHEVVFAEPFATRGPGDVFPAK